MTQSLLLSHELLIRIKELLKGDLDVLADDLSHEAFGHIVLFAMNRHGRRPAVRMVQADMGPFLARYLETDMHQIFDEVL